MRQSQLFSKTRREAPKDEVSKNAQLLIRAGYIHKEMAGVYALLPLGLRVVENIKAIVREEMNAIGGQELLMTSLQRKELWEGTGRWDDEVVDVWFKSQLHAGGDVGFGWSHEEPIGDMMKNHLSSFRDLPVAVYQFQNKLRNELRAKSGIMRGREFLMKDLYSFHATKEDLDAYYEKIKQSYVRVFKRLGIGDDTFVTFAPGGAFTKFSHEFQTVCDAGEDTIYIHRAKGLAVNEEVLSDEVCADLGVSRNELEKVTTAEVGNIFNFGDTKCQDIGLYVKNEAGEQVPVWLGSYGIGITRLVGVLVEKFADGKGLVWPESVAPFAYHVVMIDNGNEAVRADAQHVYESLIARGVSVLFDDRDVRAGEKFADADLLGIPTRLVISEKTLEKGAYEQVDRATGTTTFVTESQLFDAV
jgi:prolyl-tRNA synthetase